MKPIMLKISGLQSYRELQEIDFTRLCEAGVFGIFGKTGSGKSTILDALTLALYGKVERASNGTQGIMNHAEQALYVSYTFELTDSDGSHRFRVERQFKRKDEVSIHNTISRLVQESGISQNGAAEMVTQETVLADKLGEVNSKIEQLLGLTMHDFTRAVVLPQGKFAEFLTLKGSERRQMLQRLFHLERYGNLLLERLNVKVKATDLNMREVVAEQQGLGDASEQALQEALQSLEKAKKESAELKQQLEHWEKDVENKKQIRQWQLEKQQAEQELMNHQAKKEDMYSLEKRLEQAAMAERLAPVHEEYTLAVHRLKEAKEQYNMRQAEYDSAALQDTAEATALEQAENELKQNETPLIVQLEQFRQAKALQLEIDSLMLTIDQFEQQLTSERQQLLEIEEQITKDNELYQRALAKQNELKEQLKANEVKHEERHTMESAYREKQAYTSLLHQADQLRTEEGLKVTSTEEIERQIVHMKQSQQTVFQQMAEFVEKLAEAKASSLFQTKELQAYKAQLDQAYQDVKKSEEFHSRNQLAYTLAENLVDGQPCPVCGSAHHPEPVKPILTDIVGRELSGETSESIDKQYQQLTIQLQNELLQLQSDLLLIDQLEKQLEQRWLTNGIEQIQTERKIAVTSDPIKVRSRDNEKSWDNETTSGLIPLNELKLQWDQTFTEVEILHAQIATYSQQIKELINQDEQLQRPIQELLARFKAESLVISELKSKISKYDDQIRTAESNWQLKYPLWTIQSIDDHFHQLEQKGVLSDQLRTRIDQSIPFIESTIQRLEQTKQLKGENEKRMIQIQTAWDGQQQLLQEKRKRLVDAVGHTPIDQKIVELEVEIQRLKQTAQEKRQSREEARRKIQLADNLLAAARMNAENTSQYASQTESKWQTELQKTQFQTADEMRQALFSEADLHEAQVTVRVYREQEQNWLLQIKKLNELLPQQSISEEEWTSMMGRLDLLKQGYETAISQMAKAERDVEDLQLRHQRWSELELQLVQLQIEFSRLGKLQSALRGNAFIEFVAEEQLMTISLAASERLRFLTRQRYAIEVDSSGGFVIRDDANGGIKRPVSTLSGGETFLTSLALALALSTQIQLRGQFPLEFFFLDEGFGTLDSDLLEAVVHALEKLHTDKLTVGVISHVPELRERLPRRLIVESAEPSGKGSRVHLEFM